VKRKSPRTTSALKYGRSKKPRFRGLTHTEPHAWLRANPLLYLPQIMANSSAILDWCIVRLGEDHNWWVDEVSDPIRWDTDGLSIIDPRQAAHLIELCEPLRDYGFDQDMFEAAFIPFRIEKEAPKSRIRLKRVKDSVFDSEDKLFLLADVVDDENGPFADLLDHLTRARVKLLNDVFKFESKLTVDEVEDELREDQNASFIEGKAVHVFDELLAILDYTPAGFDEDEEDGERTVASEDDAEIDDADLPDVDDEDDASLKGDASLKWDEDEDEDEDADTKKRAGASDDEEDEEEDKDSDSDFDDEDDDEDETPKSKPKAKAKPAPKAKSKSAKKR
jgi:hypothetical protein